MAQTEPVQHASNARAMHNNAALCKLEAQFVKRQITLLSHTFTEPWFMIAQLAAADMALSSWQQRARFTIQDNKVFTNRGDTQKCRDASRWVLPSSTNATTRERNSIGCDLPMTGLLPATKESQIGRFENLNQKTGDAL